MKNTFYLILSLTISQCCFAQDHDPVAKVILDKLSNKTIIPKKYLELFNSSIIFENKDFLILNKWTGIATQEGSKINISIDHIIKHFF